MSSSIPTFGINEKAREYEGMERQKKILVVGSGGHAKVVIDTLERLRSCEIAGFVAPGRIGAEIYRGHRLIGHDEDLPKLFAQGIKTAVLGIGFMGRSNVRNRLFEQLSAIGYELPVLVDYAAVVSPDAVLGAGTYVGRQAVVNAEARIGRACIINTGSIVEHECVVGDFTHVAVGAVLCGQVRIGSECLVGANSTVIQGLHIGDGCVLGAGTVVTKNVEDHILIRNNIAVSMQIKRNIQKSGGNF